MLVQLRSPWPGVPNPASSAQGLLEERGLSMMVVELSWSHWPLYHVIEEASEE